MASVPEHYESLLSGFYTWMSGGASPKIEENRQFFAMHKIVPRLSKTAVDLGSGPGFQSIPLAEKGFKVISFDLSQKLLDELENSKNQLDIITIHDDIVNFSTHLSNPVELIVCMGDTLTHLESFDKADSLFKEVHAVLEKDGRFVMTFRDLTTPMKELDRFIPVKSDENTIFTCFLEYENQHVKVHDLVYTKDNGVWTFKKSFYRKLRIPMEWVTERLGNIGFQIEISENARGLIT
ncbi:Methyltransferase domain protein [uncultured archaeon]|nr:Methyltransferase domain protein [uncultured archaeon]